MTSLLDWNQNHIAVLTDDKDEIKKQNAQKPKLNFEDYKNCLEGNKLKNKMNYLE